MTEQKVGLGLSGGGYRATLFNLGTLIRLNELGLLRKIKRITSVSGGSITSGFLAKQWRSLEFNNKGIAQNFTQIIVQPLWVFCSKKLDAGTIIRGLLDPFHTINQKITKAYNKDIFDHFKMADIPIGEGIPQFLFYGSNLQTGSPVRMMQNMLYDWKVGAIKIDDWDMATVVGISSAFPPFLSPVILKLNPNHWIKGKYATCFNEVDYKKKVYLTDGGVYDNMGMESLWKKFQNELVNNNQSFKTLLKDDIDCVLISDAGAPLSYQKKAQKNWFSLTTRALDIVTDQARALRKRWFINKLQRKTLSGTYWGITTNIDNYEIPDALVKDNNKTRQLRNIKTRLTRFSDEDKGQLINWGYALADAGMRRHMKQFLDNIPDPKWPYSKYSL